MMIVVGKEIKENGHIEFLPQHNPANPRLILWLSVNKKKELETKKYLFFNSILFILVNLENLTPIRVDLPK